VAFATGAAMLDSIKIVLEYFDFCGQLSVVVVKLTVASDLASEPPVALSGDGMLEVRSQLWDPP